MKHCKFYWISLAATALLAAGCADSISPEDEPLNPPNTTPCTDGTWKCDDNVLSKCEAGNWVLKQTCDVNSTCDEQMGECILLTPPEIKCQPGEHIFANQCEPDDVNHCGTHTNDCTQITGWKSGNCIDKTCFADDCASGYHIASSFDENGNEKTICAADSHDACGSINTQCGIHEICSQGECKNKCQPGEVVCNGSCINPKSNADYCGADATCRSYIPCSEFQYCIDGKCVLSSCQKAEESLCTGIDQNVCVDVHGNNPYHCGACGSTCADTETAKTTGCNQGKCTYMCNDNKINCGSSTDPLCLPREQLKTDAMNCGRCNKACEANELCRDGQCMLSSCTGNACLYDNACVNLNDHCGTQCTNCNTANHAAAGYCQSGTCIITACANGYHLTTAGTCEIDSATACPNGHATGSDDCNALEYTESGICEDKICKAKSCKPNAHLEGDVCVPDTTVSCGSSGTDCTQMTGWNAGKCEDGLCVATTCRPGFCLNPLHGQCTSAQSNTTCGIDGGACKSCTTKQICSEGACIDKVCEGNVCQQNAGANQEAFCQNDNTHCGSSCQNCNTFTSHAVAGVCNAEGYCQVTACEKGSHLFNNACELDDIDHCGAHGNKCDKPNATNACNDGTCSYTCKPNYHVYMDQCELDSPENCGDHGKRCNVANATNACNGGTCSYTCNSNHHVYLNQCEPDSPDNCGIHGNKCDKANATNTCNGGVCNFTCNDKYHKYGDICELDSTENCGEHGKKCNVENATNSCENGTCSYTCKPGYHLYNRTCEKDDTDNCGTHGTTCHANVTNATDTCSNGVCSFTCNPNYHIFEGACEADTNEHCGEHGKACRVVENASSASCIGGQCIYTCNAGYEQSNNACVSTSFVVELGAFEGRVYFPIQGREGTIVIDWGGWTDEHHF